MKNDEQRILLSKLQISNHSLEIERGRHRGLILVSYQKADL
jgi:hypothetical protein